MTYIFNGKEGQKKWKRSRKNRQKWRSQTSESVEIPQKRKKVNEDDEEVLKWLVQFDWVWLVMLSLLCSSDEMHFYSRIDHCFHSNKMQNWNWEEGLKKGITLYLLSWCCNNTIQQIAKWTFINHINDIFVTD